MKKIKECETADNIYMNNSKCSKIVAIIIINIILICISGFFLYKSTQKTVYIEYINTVQNPEDVLNISEEESVIEQEFTIPYKMFYGIGLLLETYDRDNNSIYEVDIIDKTENKQIATLEINSTNVKNNEVHKLLLDSPIKVDNSHLFSAQIKATK